MIFQRLIWAALATAVVVGSVQTGVQRWQALPLILAAEVYESQKAGVPEQLAPAVHSHLDAAAHHEHAIAKTGEPENNFERTGWTWVANSLHAFSMALLVFAVMGMWLYQRGASVGSLALAGWIAAAGFVSLHLWPSLGLQAEVPGLESAPLRARQLWWVLAVGSAAGAFAVASFARASWRWLVVASLLVMPFLVGAPHLQGDAVTGYTPDAKAALEQLLGQFVWATTWVALSFWVSMGVVGGMAFHRLVRPQFLAILTKSDLS
jgi:cobalt transporter subunit CbtA